jgi:hypothetical protein
MHGKRPIDKNAESLTYMHMHLNISTPHDLFDMPEQTQEITDGGVWVEMVYGLQQNGRY